MVTHVELPGSEWPAAVGATAGDRVPAHEPVRISIVLRRRTTVERPYPKPRELLHSHLSRAEFLRHYGADAAELEQITKTLSTLGWTADGSDLARRTAWFAGTAHAVQQAFQVTLRQTSDAQGRSYRSYEGPLKIPASIASFVVGVFGLDTRPIASSRARRARRPLHGSAGGSAQARAFLPPEVAALYSFPPGTSGSGQAIGFIELGGGFNQSDLDAAFKAMKFATPKVVAVAVDAANSPGQSLNDDEEVALDLQVAGGCAPGATLVAYFSTPTDMGFLDAVSAAVNDAINNPSVISISWGGSEDLIASMTMTAADLFFADAGFMGITVCAASGDHGASGMDSADGTAHAHFPATCPNALGCGGTELRVGSNGPDEQVWNDHGASGGGISTIFAVPTYQMSLTLPASVNPGAKAGRGVPDVAANASPSTGFAVIVDGQTATLGGTSAAAPLWAALIARLNESLGGQLGFLHPALYALRNNAVLNDITVGNNDVGSDNGGYSANAGWDCCTGLGTPIGSALLSNLTPTRLRDFFAPNNITCGYSDNGELWIDSPYGTDVHIQVTSDDTGVVAVHATPVVIPAGSLSSAVTFDAPARASPFRPMAVLIHATYGGKTLTTTAYVVPPRVIGLELSSTTVRCGHTVSGTIRLDRASLMGPIVVQILCGAPGFATVPPNVTIDQGQTSSLPFSIRTPNIVTPFATANVSLLAILRVDPTDPGSSASAILEVQPQVVMGILKSLSLSASEISQGSTCYGIVRLEEVVSTPTSVAVTALDPLLPGGNSLPTGSNTSSLVSLPSSITIPAGQLQGQFAIKALTSSLHGTQRKVTIMAGAIQSWTRTLTIDF